VRWTTSEVNSSIIVVSNRMVSADIIVAAVVSDSLQPDLYNLYKSNRNLKYNRSYSTQRITHFIKRPRVDRWKRSRFPSMSALLLIPFSAKSFLIL